MNLDEKILFDMLRIRKVEEAIADSYADQEMRCPTHLCIGQEAIAVGVCAALKSRDKVFSNHRAHGHYLAKGGSLKAMMAELYGCSTGCCGGRGGSMHLIDLSVGFMGSTPIVGGTVPLAVGAAWASALKKTDELTVVFFGDGCFEEGVVHESLNFAALHQLPILFVCENNNFSVYTPLEKRQPKRPLHKIAAAHGISASAGNGNDFNEVSRLAADAAQSVRDGLGPHFIEFSTFRWREHCGPNFDNDLEYRSLSDIQTGLADCPIDRYKTGLAKKGIDVVSKLEKMEHTLLREINEAFAFAINSQRPSPTEASEKIFG